MKEKVYPKSNTNYDTDCCKVIKSIIRTIKILFGQWLCPVKTVLETSHFGKGLVERLRNENEDKTKTHDWIDFGYFGSLLFRILIEWFRHLRLPICLPSHFVISLLMPGTGVEGIWMGNENFQAHNVASWNQFIKIIVGVWENLQDRYSERNSYHFFCYIN